MAAGRMTTNTAAVSNTDSFPSVSGGPMSPVGHGFSPSGGSREQSVSSPGAASWPGGPPSLQHPLGWTHLFSTSDPPASRFHLEHLWGDVAPSHQLPISGSCITSAKSLLPWKVTHSRVPGLGWRHLSRAITLPPTTTIWDQAEPREKNPESVKRDAGVR